MRSAYVLRIAQNHLRRAQSITTSVFDYVLPQDRIASRPLAIRSDSKLLVVNGQPPKLQDKHFFDLPQVLPSDSIIVRNVSRVIPARLLMRKKTGGRCELMLLSPVDYIEPSKALTSNVLWKCFVGGRRIKVGDDLTAKLKGSELNAKIVERDGQNAVVSLSVDGDSSLTLREALNIVGRTPLPPYIKQRDDEIDKHAYQTVYAVRDGSVAAPTAGLHMTGDVMAALNARGIAFADITLHVGAGTFAPLTGVQAGDHNMHDERAFISRDTLKTILKQVQERRPVVSLGTTSVRTLESLYWLGVGLINDSVDMNSGFFKVGQWDPYRLTDLIGSESLPSASDALEKILDCNDDEFPISTELLIVPGYHFKIIDVLITNFHQPRSTLLMLISAFAGTFDEIKNIYKHAVMNDYRFLSYGDSSVYFLSRITH